MICEVGIIFVAGELEVAIQESLRARVSISEMKLKCFRVVSNAYNFDVLRFYSGLFGFSK